MQNAGALTVSDGCARGEREDVSGQILVERLEAAGFSILRRGVVPDEREPIAAALRDWRDADCALIITTGGTGFAPRDLTPEATRDVIERDAPGLSELLRWTGYQKFPRAVLSRGVAGVSGRTLIINLPGSPGGVREGMDALAPLLPHAVAILRDEPVDHTPNSSIRPEIAPEAADSPLAEIVVLEANLDDLSPEFFEPVMERLFAAGALDVTLSALQMKKNRPGILLSVLAPVMLREALAKIVFQETSTLGIRHTLMARYVLERRSETVKTNYGPIRVKIGAWQGEETVASPEYEDVKAASNASGVPFKTVHAAVLQAYFAASKRE